MREIVQSIDFDKMKIFEFMHSKLQGSHCRQRVSSGIIFMVNLIFVAVLFCSIFQVVGFGQMTSKQQVDYGKAIEELIKLGFPDVKGARYVFSSDEMLTYSGRSMSSVMSSDNSPKLKGNGFYLPSSENAEKGKFVSLTGEVYPYSKARQSTDQTGRQTSLSGKLNDADLKKDIEEIKIWVLKQSSDTNKYYGSNHYSLVLSFLGLAYQAGSKDDANEVMKLIFLNDESPEKTIDQLVHGLASDELTKLYEEFNKKQDWQVYYAGLLRLQEKFPRGWKDHQGLSILIPLVKDRVDKKPIPFPKIAGHEFSDKIKTLIEETTIAPKDANGYYGSGGLFVIDKQEVDKNAPAIMRLTGHGMEGFIALVSMIGDETLVSYDLEGNHGNHYYHSYSSDDGKSAEDAYDSLLRPKTRGEMAEEIILDTLPHDDLDIDEMGDEQFRELAIEWWREHKDDDKTALIKNYFEHGNSSHTSSLAMTLIQQNTEESRKFFEESTLTGANPENKTELVKTYVQKRRAKAKDFLLKYEKVLLDTVGEQTSRDSEINAYSIQEAGGTKKLIASFMQYTEALKPEVLFANLAKKGSDVQIIMEMIGSVYSGDELLPLIPKFVQIAANTDDTNKRDLIVQNLCNMIFVNGDTDGLSVAEANAKPEKRKISFSDEEKRDWLKLLEAKSRGSYYGSEYMLGMILDHYVHTNISSEDYEGVDYLGNQVMGDLIKARSIAFLDGKEAEPLPNEDLVSDDRKKKILDDLAEVEALKLREMVAGLNYSEKLVLSMDRSYRSKMMAAGNYLKGIEVSAGGGEAEAKIENAEKMRELLKPMLDQKAEPKVYAEIAKVVMGNIELFQGVEIFSGMSNALPGSDLTIRKSQPIFNQSFESVKEEILTGKREAVVVVAVSQRQNNSHRGNQEATLKIFDKDSPADAAKLAEITETNEVTINLVNKKVIADWSKLQANGKEQIINELLLLQPGLQDVRSSLLQMDIKQLQEALDGMKQR